MLIERISGDQIDGVDDLSWVIRMLLEDAGRGSIDIGPIPGVRNVEDHPREFVVGVRMQSKRFRVVVTEEPD